MLQQGELGVVRCEKESARGVHLDSKVGGVKRMHLCKEGSIKISYREIEMFHLPGHSIAIIAILNVSKVANGTTTGSKQISVLGFAVEVIDKQGDDSPFLVIEYSKKGVDTSSYSCYNPSAEPTILHSKGRITYLPSFSVILGAQTKLRTCTSPLIAIALQTSTMIVYPILWRRQVQLCLNTVRRVDCHLSQESSPTSPPWLATLGRDNVQPNNRSKTQEQPTQPASTPTAPPQKPRNSRFFFPGGRGGRGWLRWGNSDTSTRTAEP